MPSGVVQSFNTLNYSGMLFNKGNTRVPFSTMLAGKEKITDHVEFVTGQEYDTGSSASQPAISETASLTAPSPTYVTRAQKTNVTQIFHETVGISYAKQSNMGTLSGLNVAGQQANPMNELDFQTARKIEKIRRDIEFTFIQGSYNKATSDATINKTRGMVEAITTNVMALSNKPVTFWDVTNMMKMIDEANAPIDRLVIWCDNITRLQLNADAISNGLTVFPANRNVNGINITTIVTPLGDIGIATGQFLPAGTALFVDFDVVAPVYQPVPGKGNFFREPLSKTGAGETYQIFGQIGLDHGPEWFHGKMTGIATTFTAPAGKKVVVVNEE